MRNFFKSEFNVIMFICAIAFLIIVGFKGYSLYAKTQLSQEVNVLEDMDKYRRAYDWSRFHENDSINKNPFFTSKIIYELKTSFGNINNYNYGTEAEILAIKCKVAKETIEEDKLYQRLKIEAEQAEIRQDSLNELALERLNAKSCN